MGLAFAQRSIPPRIGSATRRPNGHRRFSRSMLGCERDIVRLPHLLGPQVQVADRQMQAPVRYCHFFPLYALPSIVLYNLAEPYLVDPHLVAIVS